MESLELLPSQSPGGGKMLEAVTSSNIFKWTQPTGGHSMGIQTDLGTFIFELHWVGSAIQFVGCTRLRTQFTCLRTELTVEVAEGLYCSGKMSDPGWTQLTHVGIQTDLGPLFSSFTGSVLHDSPIQFSVALGYWKHSLRNELRMN